MIRSSFRRGQRRKRRSCWMSARLPMRSGRNSTGTCPPGTTLMSLVATMQHNSVSTGKHSEADNVRSATSRRVSCSEAEYQSADCCASLDTVQLLKQLDSLIDLQVLTFARRRTRRRARMPVAIVEYRCCSVRDVVVSLLLFWRRIGDCLSTWLARLLLLC